MSNYSEPPPSPVTAVQDGQVFFEAQNALRKLSPKDFAAAIRRHQFDGKVSESLVLELLSSHWSIPRIDLGLTPPDPELKRLFSPQFCLRHGIIPVARDENSLTLATARPEGFSDVCAALAIEGLTPPETKLKPALAPISEIQRAIANLHQAGLTEAMATRVSQNESCRSWSPTKRRQQAIFLSLFALGVFTLIFPVLSLLAATVWAMGSLLLVITLKTGAALCNLRPEGDRSKRPLSADQLPRISIIVPLYHERHIAGALLLRLAALKYPRDHLEVVLALEENDHITLDTLSGLPLPPWMKVVKVPEGCPRTKPRAMNYALDFCHGDIIGVYDAEDWPAPDQLMKMAAHFASAPANVACLQGALDYYNPHQNWLARCFTVEYNAWFRLILPGMSRMGLAVPLGGTTLFVKRDVLERVGAWDAHNVTEDADLGFRLARHGYRTEIFDSTTGEEANCHTIPWIKQRSRWLKGYMVTYLVHMRAPLTLLDQLGPRRFVGFNAHFIGTISQFILAPLMWSFLLILFGLPHPLAQLLTPWALTMCWVLFLAAEGVNLALGAIGALRGGHRGLLIWCPTMILYYPLGCIAIYKALYELIVCPFYWDKTQHGHSLAPRISIAGLRRRQG